MGKDRLDDVGRVRRGLFGHVAGMDSTLVDELSMQSGCLFGWRLAIVGNLAGGDLHGVGRRGSKSKSERLVGLLGLFEFGAGGGVDHGHQIKERVQSDVERGFVTGVLCSKSIRIWRRSKKEL